MKNARSIATAIVSLASLTCAGHALAASPQLQGVGQPAPAVWRSEDIVNAIGVTAHLGYDDPTSAYRDPAETIAALNWLGINSVRTALPALSPGDPRFADTDAILDAGFNVMFNMMPQQRDNLSIMDTLQQAADRFATKYPNQILALEGLNEPDITSTGFSYANLVGPAAVAQYTIDLYTMVKNDPALASIPVWEFCLNTFSRDAYEAVYWSNPSVLNAFDVAQGPAFPSYWSQGWMLKMYMALAFDVLNASTAPQMGPFSAALANRPIGVKEAGEAGALTPNSPLGIADYTAQAKLLPSELFDTLALGSSQTFIYELFDVFPDPASGNNTEHFGLFDNAWNPKPAAFVIHNLLYHLKDVSPYATTFIPAPLTVTVPEFPLLPSFGVASGTTLVAQRASTTYQIAVWYEPDVWDANNGVDSPVPDPQVVHLQLSQSCGHSAIFDPYTNTLTPGPDNTNVIPVPLSDHLVLVDCHYVY